MAYCGPILKWPVRTMQPLGGAFCRESGSCGLQVQRFSLRFHLDDLPTAEREVLKSPLFLYHFPTALPPVNFYIVRSADTGHICTCHCCALFMNWPGKLFLRLILPAFVVCSLSSQSLRLPKRSSFPNTAQRSQCSSETWFPRTRLLSNMNGILKIKHAYF